MRILIAFPGHFFSTIDVATGYASAFRALGHEVSEFNYHHRLAFYEIALGAWKERNPAFEADESARFVLASETLAVEAVDFVPDAVIVVNGLALHKRALDLLYKLAIPAFLLLTESPYRDYEQAVIAKLGRFAGIFANDKVSVEPLQEETGLPVCYLPHSFDPGRHYPQNVGPEYTSDVYFFGTLWPERKTLFQDLMARQNGYHFDIGGAELDRPEGQAPRLEDNDEMARHYSGTKCALNHHRTIVGVDGSGQAVHVEKAWSLGPRAFEIAACGAFQLCDDTRPELHEIFGDSVAVYRDAADLAEKVEYYLRHDAEREEMAAQALARVQPCSFEMRARSIIEPFVLEVLNGSSLPRS